MIRRHYQSMNWCFRRCSDVGPFQAVLLGILFAFPLLAHCAEINVCDAAELKQAVASAPPGTIILIAPGGRGAPLDHPEARPSSRRPQSLSLIYNHYER